MILPTDLYWALARAGQRELAAANYSGWVEDPRSMKAFASHFIHIAQPGSRLMSMFFDLIFEPLSERRVRTKLVAVP